jgi:3-oxoacyl-[acyl-carrier protein] reductase
VPLVLEGEIAYIASKSAVEAFTKVLAKDLAQFKITVNAVGPTPADTDLISRVPKEKIDSLIAKQAIRRMAQFSDISNVIDFFIAPASDFVTGQIVYLGGVS